MRKIFFLIGASGSGKTTVAKRIKQRDLTDFKIIYFDSIGVPTIEEMNEKYGGPEEWQRVKTIEWVQIIKNEFLNDTHVLFDGQTRPTFIEQACRENEISTFEVILFDCSDKERKRRLVGRGDAALADENMMNWAKYLREESLRREYRTIDTTHLKIEEAETLLLKALRPEQNL